MDLWDGNCTMLAISIVTTCTRHKFKKHMISRQDQVLERYPAPKMLGYLIGSGRGSTSLEIWLCSSRPQQTVFNPASTCEADSKWRVLA